MRISCVSVTNLFGMFNHRIPFNLNEHITIIHGPNGFGKTVLLRMINALLQQRYSEIRDIPFDQFIIEFDDKTSIRIVKTKMSEKKTLSHVMSEKRKFVADYKFATDYNLSIEFFKNDSKAESYVPKPVIQPGFPLEMIERIIPELGRCGSHSWLYLPTNEELSLDEVMTRFGSLLERYCKVSKCEPPEWLRKIYNSINIRFIETQRILDFQKNRERHRFIGNFEPVPVVNIYSEELAKAIQAKLAEYATLSQSLDRTFPNRLVRGNGKTLSTDSLKKKLSELENERSRLMATGFLDKEGEIDDFKEFQTINKSNENVLFFTSST